MEVRQAIDDLRSSLNLILSEDELLGRIDVQLPALRQSFPSNRSSFSPSDIEFLKSLAGISDHLRAFIELREELPSVTSLQEYTDLRRRLVRIKGSLAHFPVGKRIAKEIRELNERLPVIRDQDKVRLQSRIDVRIRDLEQNPRRCPRHHPMVIREGTQGYFWGCSRYPSCSATAQLTPRENGLLRQSPVPRLG